MKTQSSATGHNKRSVASKFQIREIKEGDMESAAELIARLKRLNGEFDPLLKTSEKAEADSLRILKETFRDNDHLVLVAVSGSRVVGVAKAQLRDRIFYEPRMEGAIVELYIIPEFRRGSLGRDLFDMTVTSLRKKGAQLVTAEFPSQNEIAKKFYTKLGFRSLTNVYAKPS
jgi:ribosomal protein S18 acetylase RimI-like enzyme